jgi:hypothetical protein
MYNAEYPFFARGTRQYHTQCTVAGSDNLPQHSDITLVAVAAVNID